MKKPTSIGSNQQTVIPGISKTNKNNSKPPDILADKKKSKSRQRKLLVVISGGVIFLGLMLTMIVAVLLKPEISVSHLESAEIQNIPVTINREVVDYPTLGFQDPHKVKLATGEERIIQQWSTTKDNFVEGENIITAQRVQDYFFFRLVGNEKTEKKIVVDRIAPKPEIVGDYPSYVLLDDLILEVEHEADSEVIVGEKVLLALEFQESEPSELDTQKVSADLVTRHYKLELVDGKNEIKLFERDNFGNLSSPIEISLDAYKPIGSQKLYCTNLSFPLDRNNLQVGYQTGSNNTSQDLYSPEKVADISNGCDMNGFYYGAVKIFPNGTPPPCSGPCDAYSDYINIGNTSKSLQDYLQELTTNVSRKEPYNYTYKGTAEKYTTKRGLQGYLVSVDITDDMIFSQQRYKIFIFSHRNTTYHAHVVYAPKYTSQESIDTRMAQFNQIIEAMIIE